MTTMVNNRYEVVRPLGRGGMGQVYLVTDLLNEGERLALKEFRLRPGREGAVDHFKQEFLTLSRLSHPNLAQVHDFGALPDGGYYFTTDYVDGEDLYKVSEGLDFDELFEVVVQICRGLEYIHSRGIIHRDVKPANILIATGGEELQVKLIDFGLAEDVSIEDSSEAIRGTVSYLAPEVLRGEPVDRRADLYALGVTLYYAATRTLPFSGNSNLAVIQQHLSERHPPAHTVREGIPEVLCQLIDRLMEKDPGRRISSAHQVIQFLNRSLEQTFSVETHRTREAYITTGKLVGREEELEFLEEALEWSLHPEGRRKRTGEDSTLHLNRAPSLVLVAGEAGIGKSRLMREFKSHVQISGFDYYEGRCFHEGGAAYQPFIEVLRRLVHLTRPLDDDPTRPAVRQVHKLERLLTDLERPPASGLEEAELAPEERKLQLFDRITRFFLEFASHRGMVLAFTDLHWADPDTVELFHYLCRNLDLVRTEAMKSSRGPRLTPPRLLVVGSYRPADIEGTLLEETIAFMQKTGFLGELSLRRLDSGAVEQLLGSMLGDGRTMGELSRRVYRETRGNPFFIEELLKSLLEGSVLELTDRGWKVDDLESLELPSSIDEVLHERLERLGGPEGDLARLLAVVARPLSLEELSQVSALERPAIIPLLDRLERKQILEIDRDGEVHRYGLLHDVLREALYQSIPRETATELHRQVGEVFEELLLEEEDQPEQLGELVHHFEEAGDADKAFRYALLAAERAEEVYANQRAIQLLRTARRLAPADRPRDQADILERMGEVYDLVGDYERAVACYQQILERVEERPGVLTAEEQGAVMRKLGQVFEKQGQYEQAVDSLKEGLRTLGRELRSYEGARILNATGSVFIKEGRYREAIQWSQSGLDLLEGFEEGEEAASIHDTLGVAHARQGEYGPATEHLERALHIWRQLGHLRGIAQTLNHLGTVFSDRGELLRAVRFFEESLHLQERIGFTLGVAETASHLGTAYHGLGKPSQAIDYHQKALGLVEKLGDVEGVIRGLNELGRVHLETSDLALAHRQLKRARRLGAHLGEARGQVVAATELARVLVELGSWDEAEDLLHEVLETVSQSAMRRDEGLALQYLGRLYSRRGEFDEAERSFNAALTIFSGMENELAMAQVMLDVVELFHRRGDAELGRMVLGQLPEELPRRLAVRRELALCRLSDDSPKCRLERLSEALEEAEAFRSPELVWRLCHEMSQIHEQRGHYQAGLECLVRAMEIIRKVWSRITDPELQAGYLQDPERQEVRADFVRLKGKLDE